jgi:hypothetical protein
VGLGIGTDTPPLGVPGLPAEPDGPLGDCDALGLDGGIGGWLWPPDWVLWQPASAKAIVANAIEARRAGSCILDGRVMGRTSIVDASSGDTPPS